MKKSDRANLLLDHHKDTFQYILYHWRIRNRLFIFVLIILALMALDTYSQDSIAQVVNGYLARVLNSTTPDKPILDFNVVGCVIWFLLLSLVISYYQRSITVDRQYRYIDQLEEKINSAMGGEFITREGKSYHSKSGAYTPGEKQQQPWFIRMVGPLYTYFFPAILVMFVVYKLLDQDVPPKDVTDVFNLVIGAVIVCYNVLYVLWVVGRK